MKVISQRLTKELLLAQQAEIGNIISQAEASRLLCCSRQHISNLIKDEKLNTFLIAGRKCVSKLEVKQLLEARRSRKGYQHRSNEFDSQVREQRKNNLLNAIEAI